MIECRADLCLCRPRAGLWELLPPGKHMLGRVRRQMSSQRRTLRALPRHGALWVCVWGETPVVAHGDNSSPWESPPALVISLGCEKSLSTAGETSPLAWEPKATSETTKG